MWLRPSNWTHIRVDFQSSFLSVGMDTLNSAIENLMTSSSKEDWPSVNMNVADATVTVINEKVGTWRRDRLQGGLGYSALS